jgi:hypothetical protein
MFNDRTPLALAEQDGLESSLNHSNNTLSVSQFCGLNRGNP